VQKGPTRTIEPCLHGRGGLSATRNILADALGDQQVCAQGKTHPESKSRNARKGVLRVPGEERAAIEVLSNGVERVRLQFDCVETPNINRALGQCRRQGLDFEGRKTSFFLVRRKLVASPDMGMSVSPEVHAWQTVSKPAKQP
jgi:hypothetical protein